MNFFIVVSIVFAVASVMISASAIFAEKKKFSKTREGLIMLAIGFSSISQFLYIFTDASEGGQAVQTVRVWAQYLTAGAGIFGVLYGLRLCFATSVRETEPTGE